MDTILSLEEGQSHLGEYMVTNVHDVLIIPSHQDLPSSI